IKDRILEYLAVLKLKGDMKSPILCLSGPPGVVKLPWVSLLQRQWDANIHACHSAAFMMKPRSGGIAKLILALCLGVLYKPLKRQNHPTRFLFLMKWIR